MNIKIATELIDLAKTDLAVRERLLKEGGLRDGYNPEMEHVHKSNAARLKNIIAQIGWPTVSLVGEEASEAAWLIVQHSIGDPVLLRSSLVLMREAGSDINPQNIAYLYDRICYFEGRPQKYGTQFDDAGLYPVENAGVVNNLRADLKLKAHATDAIVEAKQTDQHQDIHAKNTAFNEWRKIVGWI